MGTVSHWFLCLFLTVGTIPLLASIESRIQKGILYHILQNDPQEAWRLILIASRIGVVVDQQEYLSHLSLALSGVCPLIEFDDTPNGWLLAAYTYRYRSSFAPRDYRYDPFSHRAIRDRQFHLSSDLLPYMDEIASTSLIRGQGCHWLKSRITNPEAARQYELEALINWYKNPHNPMLANYESILIRIVELATKETQADLVQDILQIFAKLDLDQWLSLSFSEQVFIWEKLKQENFLANGPYKKGSREYDFTIAILQKSKHRNTSNWLALVNYHKIDQKLKQTLVDHLLEVDKSHRSFFLYEKARLAYEKGKFFDALNIVRRLTVMGEANGNENLMESATKIALKIFVEHRFDRGMAGAIQKSIPRGTWSRIMKELYIDLALAGDWSAITKLDSFIEEMKVFRTVNKSHKDLLGLLANRNLRKLEQTIKKICSRRRIRGNDLRLFESIVGRSIALTPTQREKLTPFEQLMARCLKPHSQSPRVAKIYEYYLPQNTDKESKGMEQVIQGSQSLGVVNLDKTYLLEPPFEWDTSLTPPIHPLLVVPKSYDSLEWAIWVEDGF